MSKRRVSIACRIVCLVVMAGTIAACDRCGDWFRFESQSCRDQAPRPQ